MKYYIVKKVKVKVPLTDPKAQRGVDVYLYSFLISALEGVGGQHHAPADYGLDSLEIESW
jgi:hypothetical protein